LLLREASPQKKAHVFSGKMKLPELMKFVASFALPKASAKAERVLDSQSKSNINSKKIETGFKVIDSMEALDKDILQNHKPGLVLFLDKEQAQADRFMQLLTGIALKVKEFVNVVVFNVDASVLLGKVEKDKEL